MSGQVPPVPRPGEGEPIVFMDITLGGEVRFQSLQYISPSTHAHVLYQR